MNEAFTIGELARRAEVTRDTIRFYERVGLLPPPTRTRSGYRIFGDADVRRVRFVREAQSIGLTLDGIQELLSVSEMQTPEECRRVAEQLARRIDEIDEKIRELQTFRERLEVNRQHCQEAHGSSCPVVLDLVEAVSGPDGRTNAIRSDRGRPPAGHTF
jgi:MerR family Zn(II)-responsive transcriptional regulator of zntA